MKKSGKKNYVLILVFYAIVCVLINVLVFTVFKPGKIEEAVAKKAFWFSYAFLMVSLGLHIGTLFTFNAKRGIDAIFMGMPLYVISAIFFAIEAFISTVFMILGDCNVNVPTTLVVVLQILVLGVYLCISVLALLAKNVVEEIDTKIVTNVQNIRNLYADVEVAMEACTDLELKNGLRKFAENIRFSDPMSNDAIADLDRQIKVLVEDLKQIVYEENYESVQTLLRKGNLLLLERNKKVANSK